MTWPDVEGAMKEYLSTHVASARGVWIGVPEGALDDGADTKMFPMITVQRVGGGQDPSEAEVDLALIQLTVIGRMRGAQGCWNCTAELRSVLAAIRGNTALRSDVVAYGAEVNSVVFAADADGRPRYAVTTLVTAASAV